MIAEMERSLSVDKITTPSWSFEEGPNSGVKSLR